MKNQQRYFIELLISTMNSSGFVYRSIPKSVFISFLKLRDEYVGEKKRLKQEYDLSSRKYFEENISVPEYEDKLESKIQSFKRVVESLSPVSSYEFKQKDSLKNEYKKLYNFYCSKTGHKRGKPLTVNKYERVDLISTQKKINQIGRDCLEVELLSEIQDELEFSEIYTSFDLKIIDSVADACWEIFETYENISREKLISKVSNEYFIKKYEDLEAKEREKKVKRTAQQWVNDNQENLQIM